MAQNRNGKEEKTKIGLIGVGKVGSLVLHDLLERSTAEFYITSGNPQILKFLLPDIATIEKDGEEVPIQETLKRITVFETINGYVIENCERKSLLDSDIIVIAAKSKQRGVNAVNYPRNRDEEFILNEKLGVFTNPPGLTCEKLAHCSGIPKNRFVGITSSSTLRFRDIVARVIEENEKFKNKQLNLEEAVVIGDHGSSMVPIYSKVFIGKERFNDLPELQYAFRKIRKAIKEDPNKSQAANASAKQLYVCLGRSDRASLSTWRRRDSDFSRR